MNGFRADGEIKVNGEPRPDGQPAPKRTKKNGKITPSEKMRRRLPMSVKELIDYHSGNGKSIKDIVTKINAVCRSDEKVSYGVSSPPALTKAQANINLDH